MADQILTVRRNEFPNINSDPAEMHEFVMHAEDVARRILHRDGVAFTGKVRKNNRWGDVPKELDIVVDLDTAIITDVLSASALETKFMAERAKENQDSQDRDSEIQKARAARRANTMDDKTWDELEAIVDGGMNNAQRDRMIKFLLATVRCYPRNHKKDLR